MDYVMDYVMDYAGLRDGLLVMDYSVKAGGGSTVKFYSVKAGGGSIVIMDYS